MDIRIFKNEAEIGKAAGQLFCDAVKENPSCVLGLATGATPVPTYNYMVEEYKAGNVSFKDITTFNLDEYCDLPKEHKNSYYSFMFENLFSKIDVNADNVNFLDGNTDDPEAESARYAEAIASKGGIDVQLLGIGRNGHIGFNEPDAELERFTHLVELTPDTIEANSRFFASEAEVPKHALTMGIHSVFKARKILLLASGKNKAAAINALVKSNITTACPATLLCLHPDVTVICDEDAYSLV